MNKFSYVSLRSSLISCPWTCSASFFVGWVIREDPVFIACSSTNKADCKDPEIVIIFWKHTEPKFHTFMNWSNSLFTPSSISFWTYRTSCCLSAFINFLFWMSCVVNASVDDSRTPSLSLSWFHATRQTVHNHKSGTHKIINFFDFLWNPILNKGNVSTQIHNEWIRALLFSQFLNVLFDIFTD